MIAELKMWTGLLGTRRAKRERAVLKAGVLFGILACGALALNAQAQPGGELTDDINTVLLCHMNETEGSTVKDSATLRKPHNGTLVGKPAWVAGKFGNALEFHGAPDGVDFGAMDEVFGQAGHTAPSILWEGTIEFWFTPAADISGKAAYSDIVDCCVSPRVGINAAGQLEASWVAERWGSDNGHQLAGGPPVWKAGAWYNVKFCWDPTGHYLFVNDELVASDRLTTSMILGWMHVTLGAYWNGNKWSEQFAGKLDEVRISIVNRYPEMTAQAAGRKPGEAVPASVGAIKPGDLGPYAYDFGPGWQAPMDGFTRVSAVTAYSEKRGFGWVSGFYRNWKTDRVDWTSCLLTQTAAGWLGTVDNYAPAKFRLDCPAGKYRVFAVGGGYEWTQTDLLVAGDKKATLRTFKVPFVIRSALFEVETNEPKLELEIQSPLCRWTLCGLVVYPVVDQARVEEKLARVQHEIDDGSPECRASFVPKPVLVEPKDTAALPPADPGAQARGFMVAAVPIQDLAQPTVKPSRGQILKDDLLRMEVARDERQTQRVRLWALQRLEDIRMDPVGEMRSADGKTLPPGTVEVFRLDYQWRRRLNIAADGGVSYDSREYWLYPTKMERQGTPPWGADGTGALNMVPVNVAANHAQEFAVVVRIPTDAAPGEYLGTLAVQANHVKTELPIQVRVLPFALSDEGMPEYRFFSFIDGAINITPGPVRTAAIDYMRKELRFMKDWGADQWATTYGRPEPELNHYVEYVERPDGEKSIDPGFLHFMKICEEERMVGGKYFYLWWNTWLSYFGVPPSFRVQKPPENYADLDTNPKYQDGREKIVAEISMLLREFKERGWPEPLFGPMDEPALEDGPTLKALHNILHPLGAKLSTQTPDCSTDLKWLEIVDIPLSYNDWLFRTQCEKLHERGIPNQFWRGIWAHDRILNQSRAESGLWALYCGVDALQYAFWYIPTLNPESDLDNGGFPFEMTACYLRDFGPISSLNAEVVRTARDDARYALAVRRLIQEGKNDPARKALAEETEVGLNAMLNALGDPNKPIGIEQASKSDWDGLRRRLKNWALALSGEAVPAAATAHRLPFSRIPGSAANLENQGPRPGPGYDIP